MVLLLPLCMVWCLLYGPGYAQVCPDLCPPRSARVCGSDGVTYSNICRMHLANCRDPSIEIDFVHNGPCREATQGSPTFFPTDIIPPLPPFTLYPYPITQEDLDLLISQMYSRSEPYKVGQGLVLNRYYLSKLYMKHDMAKMACASLGGDLAEVNSQREYDFIRDFVKPHVTSHLPITISGFAVYKHSVHGNFRSTKFVNMTSHIDGVVYNGKQDRSVDTAEQGSQFPLFLDFFPDRPRPISDPPTCLGLVHRSWETRGDSMRMSNDKCRDSFRYLCEVEVDKETN